MKPYFLGMAVAAAIIIGYSVYNKKPALPQQIEYCNNWNRGVFTPCDCSVETGESYERCVADQRYFKYLKE